jgi:hypothetical protein
MELTCTEQGATTGMLDAKLKFLSSKAKVDPAILDGMTDIKFLGNDALHVESREFGQIDEDTVAAGIQVAIMVLGNLYQANNVLAALKRFRK